MRNLLLEKTLYVKYVKVCFGMDMDTIPDKVTGFVFRSVECEDKGIDWGKVSNVDVDDGPGTEVIVGELVVLLKR